MRLLFVLLLSALAALHPASALAQTSVSIHDIMVASATTTDTKYFLPDSPYLYTHYGAPVSVSGIVVGVMSSGDFKGSVYISEPSTSWDSLVATAEGMPVFNVASINSACAVVGATITVVGDVVLSNTVVPADITAADTPGTGLLPTSCTVTSTGGTMTQSISLNNTLSTFGGALEYTGMTTTATFYAVAPTSGALTESTETETSTGQFWATISSNTATNNHLFRSAGIAGDEYKPSTAPATVATWAGNPQRILIDTTTFGGTAVNITVGQTITCTVGSGIKVGATAGIGLIDYTLGYARLLIFPTSVCTVGGTIASTTSATADSTHFHVGTLDLNRFYSTTGATTGSVAVTAAAYAARLAKAANAIVSSLGNPDILALQEVQDLQTLTDLASAVNTLGGTSYVPSLIQGNDPNSLNLGFLVKSTTLVTDSVTQVGATDTYTTTSGASATLWERPPLVLKAEFVRVGKNYPVTVIDVHLTPRDNIGDATLGPDVRAHRAAQASALSALVQSYQTAGQNVIVSGNLNAFEFSDGYVDVTGVIDGSPAAATAVTLYQATSTTAALTDFVTQVASTSRYNYIERGNAESIEHILASATIPDSSTASASLASYVSAVTQPHFTADFAAVDANSSTTPEGLTPHDGFVVAFEIPPVPTTASVSPTAINFGSLDIGASVTQTVTVANTTTFASTVNVTKIAISGTNAADFSQTSTCTSLAEGATCTITVTFTPTAIGARSAVLTVTNDSTSDPVLTVTLAGTGLDTTATLTPATATFPGENLGATSAAVVFTYTNTSQVSETVNSTAITGDFSITGNTCASATIAASGTCAISVVFTPTATGARTGTLTVTDSSTGNPTLVSTLNGTGVPTTATLTPATATFASTDIGGTSATQTFTVTNTSTVAITVNKIALTGDYAQTATTCGGSLAAAATCTITVDFVPTATGSRTGTLTVANSSTGDPALVSTLTATGLDTTATLTPATADFGSIYAGGGTSAAKTFTLTNTSAISIAIKTIAITGNFSETTTCGTTLAAGASCTISVVFAPLSGGALTGTLTVTNSSTANPTLTSTLTGTGLPTTATLTPASATYTNTIVGATSAAQTFVWSNTSAIALTIGKVSTTGDFAVSSTTCTGAIAANASCTIAVVFTPTALGARTGTVTVTSTSSANPTLASTLSGRGVADVEASASALGFGNVDLGFASTPQTITVTNYTAAAISLTGIAITGDYAYTTTCGATLPALGVCTITVIFTPTAVGARAGTLTVNTNDTKYPIITVALTGNGVDFTITASPTSGTVIAGDGISLNVILTPLGGFANTLTLSCTTSAGGSTCTPTPATLALTAATTLPVNITTTSQYTVIGYSGGVGAGDSRWQPCLILISLLSAGAIFLRGRRRGMAPRLLAALLMLGVLGLSNLGCGTRNPDKNANPTYPGTYTYTLSATDGMLTHTAAYSLTVKINCCGN
ncbi:choice-of-anchor D domain-containing protein [Granulicella rosea]|uniref:choice-of-anchor D domain-containing protein n=1 Tax=Granulicella rosea TaxID=474952 RepID=UPI00159605A2|nr:choice-of-anchor D domain-containing protein [Granulicella rosea]